MAVRMQSTRISGSERKLKCAAERTKDRCKPLLTKGMHRVCGLTAVDNGKALSEMPALKPYRGKPAVRNFRREDGNGSYRAILLPAHQGYGRRT
jgi:propanediol dehydratase small subunit